MTTFVTTGWVYWDLPPFWVSFTENSAILGEILEIRRNAPHTGRKALEKSDVVADVVNIVATVDTH